MVKKPPESTKFWRWIQEGQWLKVQDEFQSQGSGEDVKILNG